jgi:hypothetical protein
MNAGRKARDKRDTQNRPIGVARVNDQWEVAVW